MLCVCVCEGGHFCLLFLMVACEQAAYRRNLHCLLNLLPHVAQLILFHIRLPAQGPIIGGQTATAPEPGHTAVLTYSEGVTPNTDYVVWLLARDDSGNLQPYYTATLVHTDDNIPPTFITYNATGAAASCVFAMLLLIMVVAVPN